MSVEDRQAKPLGQGDKSFVSSQPVIKSMESFSESVRLQALKHPADRVGTGGCRDLRLMPESSPPGLLKSIQTPQATENENRHTRDDILGGMTGPFPVVADPAQQIRPPVHPLRIPKKAAKNR